MALTVDKLINDERFSGDNVFQFLLYLPFGILILALRIVLALILWVASIILPKKSAVGQVLSTLACWTFGVYVKLKGSKDPRCSVMVANYVSCLDSLATAHVLGTISLRKWKVPPFFASTLGIKNAAQFVRKEHFAESPSRPVLLQPEGGPTNGKGVLKFTDWPFQIGNRVQPVSIKVERMYTNVTVHRGDSRSRFPWGDAFWFLCSPLTVFSLQLLPALERGDDDDATFAQRLRESIAESLGVESSEYRWEQLNSRPTRRSPPRELQRLAAQVKDVLPSVPLQDIIRDLSVTRSVDVTITNLLERAARRPAQRPAPPPPAAFPKSAKERQLSFQERKAQMIAEARKVYIEKHGLNLV
ncbi:lipid droplet-regulating VLDL assembly factor AUP1 isoform X2 [Amyelois transitella]|uniref:lipid droplet-regulating VLDL assembly factor AUP1 isoform X2 n=1 Tax=Amyelois transitella TaxID=680683 RepID=UPI00298F3F2F|nr:lipid droplet-regulating VLDL assembly factor AUP1 isoform X2 [Amyelois transitella]